MRFNELPFFIYIAIFFVIYFQTKGRVRLFFILLSSYFFYGWWDWRFLGVLWGSTAFNYLIASNLADTAEVKYRKRWLAVGVAGNLGLLGYFKYCDFFISGAIQLLHFCGFSASFGTLGVILPIGISFYTFMSLSYTFDIYRKVIEPERDWLKFAVFVTYFPHLVAGPILRPEHFLPQLTRDVKLTGAALLEGISWILLGYVKKVVVADSLAIYVDRVFTNTELSGAAGLAIATVFYAFQIYGDFSGYSDIAYGIAKIMGYDIGRNFRRPYLAQNFSDFWKRWHISLSGWLRDYLYIGLGGNRGGQWKTMRNLLFTMLLGGLWHGANWTFIAWGGLHGLLLILQRIVPESWFKERDGFDVRRILQTITVFVAICLGWIFFRANSIDQAFAFIGKFFTASWNLGLVQHKFLVAKGGGLLVGFIIFEICSERWRLRTVLLARPYLICPILAGALCLVAFAGSFDGGHFIYFQF